MEKYLKQPEKSWVMNSFRWVKNSFTHKFAIASTEKVFKAFLNLENIFFKPNNFIYL